MPKWGSEQFNIKIPQESIGRCKNYRICGTTEAILKQKDEVLGNGYCMQCYDQRVDTKHARQAGIKSPCSSCGDWFDIRGHERHENACVIKT